jgi:hypothetical protein
MERTTGFEPALYGFFHLSFKWRPRSTVNLHPHKNIVPQIFACTGRAVRVSADDTTVSAPRVAPATTDFLDSRKGYNVLKDHSWPE